MLWESFLGSKRKISLVTGGAGGLGSVIVRKLASEGYEIVLNFRSSLTDAENIKTEIGENCHIIRADVSSLPEVEEMAEYIDNNFGRLDNLINNAGITKDGPLIRYAESDWDLLIDNNLKGCFNCIQMMVPLMKNAGGGHIINISSYSGVKGKEGQPAYSAAKAGLIGLGRSLAKELSDQNIRVNTVLPGYMETKMGKEATKAISLAKKESLLNVLSDPDEVAEFIAYLCSTKNVTGQIFSLDSRII
jgi:3-oxoacyl-[acyl-carrier protein] reductase